VEICGGEIMTRESEMQFEMLQRLANTVEQLSKAITDLRVELISNRRDTTSEIIEAVEHHAATCPKKSVPPATVSLKGLSLTWRDILLIIACTGVGGSGMIATIKQILPMIGQ